MGTTTVDVGAASPVSTRTRLALLIFAMLFPSFAASLYFVFLSAGDGKPNFWQQAAYTAGKVIQFGFPVVFLLLVDRRLPRPRMPDFAGLGLGLIFGLAVAAFMLVLYYGWLGNTSLFAETGASVKQKLQEVNMLSPAKYIVLAVAIVAVHSLAEEYYWRWFTFAQLNRLMNVPLAIALSSVAFIGHHVLVLNAYFPGHFWTAVVPFSLGVGVGGAFWAWLFARTRTIYSSWLSHALVDGAIFVIGWDLLQRAGW
jgi:membrane protease YdiL (CAAX protease family)